MCVSCGGRGKSGLSAAFDWRRRVGHSLRCDSFMFMCCKAGPTPKQLLVYRFSVSSFAEAGLPLMHTRLLLKPGDTLMVCLSVSTRPVTIQQPWWRSTTSPATAQYSYTSHHTNKLHGIAAMINHLSTLKRPQQACTANSLPPNLPPHTLATINGPTCPINCTKASRESKKGDSGQPNSP